jgi:hypothetical protein
MIGRHESLNPGRKRLKRPRFSVAGLMGTVAVIALGCVGLVSASTFWTSAAATITLGLLLGAVLGAVLLRGADQSFWLGFALFGIVYLLLVDWDWFGGQLGHDLTSGLSDFAESIIPAPQVATAPIAPPLPFPSPAPAAGRMEIIAAHSVKIGNFVQIGRMTLALLFALVGGCVGRLLFDRRQRQEPMP